MFVLKFLFFSQYFWFIVCRTSTSLKFLCNSGTPLNFDLVCNGRADCADSSDENKGICFNILQVIRNLLID